MESPQLLIARYLKTNGYTKSLQAFIDEAGLSDQDYDLDSGAFTIEKLLHEKSIFDRSRDFVRTLDDSAQRQWGVTNPRDPTKLPLTPSANLLSVAVNNVLLPGHRSPQRCIMASTSDKMLHCFEATGSTSNRVTSLSNQHDSPILSFVMVDDRHMVWSTMSGQVVLFDCQTGVPLDARRDHKKYAVQVILRKIEANSTVLIASAGWDNEILLFRLDLPVANLTKLGDPVASIKTPTSPQCMMFLRHPRTDALYLLMTRRDSTLIYYYEVQQDPDLQRSSIQLTMRGQQNLAPHSNAWVAFSPTTFAICPTDPSIVAVATSSEPHMKLIIVRLLWPGTEPANLSTPSDTLDQRENSVEQSRRLLAIQNREDAAITVHCNTMSPQTPYSSPTLSWRPDGSGLWVNGDDGIVRGIEAHTGKVVARLQSHEPGSKIRCLWAGEINTTADHSSMKECLLSGGFDHQLIRWL